MGRERERDGHGTGTGWEQDGIGTEREWAERDGNGRWTERYCNGNKW